MEYIVRNITYTDDELKSMIGKIVTKTTNKPFKSGNQNNTVLDVISHPILGCPAFTFIEDDSYVECRRCKVVED